MSYSIPDCARFRVNVFRQRGSYAIVMRVIASRIPSVADGICLRSFQRWPYSRTVWSWSPTPLGCGKSSTLAAVINLINETRAEHVITVEESIEFLHLHKKATVHQRELHSNTDVRFGASSTLREAPKVILVGEMRDRETIEVALTAAETGHLVFLDAPHHRCDENG